MCVCVRTVRVVCVCVRTCVHACVRACACVCINVYLCLSGDTALNYFNLQNLVYHLISIFQFQVFQKKRLRKKKVNTKVLQNLLQNYSVMMNVTHTTLIQTIAV